MPVILRCTLGHKWESVTELPPSVTADSVCPICASLDDTTIAQQPLSLDSNTPASNEQRTEVVPSRTSNKPGLPVVDGFEILQELSRGGMGVIYKARQLGLNRFVALKVIHPEFVSRQEAANRFQREVQAAARLSHPNVVTVFSTNLTGGTPYMAMEFVNGIDLHRLVYNHGPRNVDEAIQYIRQAALGLQHAYEHRLVHRDIKPSNLMICPSPVDKTGKSDTGFRGIKILDMGLARVISESGDDSENQGGLTRAGEFLGTPDYISPEQAEDPRNADIRADLYSLGGTLYYLLTGKIPFPADSLMQKLAKHLTAPPPSVRKIRNDVPESVDAIITKLMAKKPEDRFQTPQELIVALDACLNPATAKTVFTGPVKNPASSPELVIKTPAILKKHTAEVSSIAITPDGKFLLSGSADESIRLWDLEQGKEFRCFSTRAGSVSTLCISPNGLWAASASLRLFADEMCVNLWDFTSGKERRRVKGFTTNLSALTMTPDGQNLACGSIDGSIYIWHLTSGKPPVFIKGHTKQITGLIYLNKGANLLTAGRDGVVRMWDVTSGILKGNIKTPLDTIESLAYNGKTLRVAMAGTALYVRNKDNSLTEFHGHSGLVTAVAFSSSGKYVVSGGADNTVRIWNAETTEELHVHKGHTARITDLAVTPDESAVYSSSADTTIRRWPLV